MAVALRFQGTSRKWLTVRYRVLLQGTLQGKSASAMSVVTGFHPLLKRSELTHHHLLRVDFLVCLVLTDQSVELTAYLLEASHSELPA